MEVIDLNIFFATAGSLFFVMIIILDFFNHKNHKAGKYLRLLIFFSFIFYLLNVIKLTVGALILPPDPEFSSVIIQFMPFYFIVDWIKLYQANGFDWFFWNSVKLTLYNLLMFVPLGIYLPVLFHVNKYIWVLIIAFLSSLTIEIYQPILSYFGLIHERAADVDDLILNTGGAVVGLVVVRLVRRMLKSAVPGQVKETHHKIAK